MNKQANCSSSRIRLIVGLGNPGADYEHTRHNAGAWFVQLLANQYQVDLRKESKFNAHVARINEKGIDTWLLLPTTYMNKSGIAVKALSQFYGIHSHEILIAHDELDLPVGHVRLKFDGGHGGHNGLRDTINHLSTNQFHRLRIGIGHPGNRDLVLDYVLRQPSNHDRLLINDHLEQAAAILPDLCTGKIDRATQTLHTSKIG